MFGGSVSFPGAAGLVRLATALVAAGAVGQALAQRADSTGLPQSYYAWAQPLQFEDNQTMGPLAVCFDGDNPPTEEFIRSIMAELEAAGRLPEMAGPRYYTTNRWSGTTGTPRALTWSLTKDGVSIPNGIGEGVAPNSLFASMDAKFAAQGGRATWVGRIQQCFDRWQEVTGITYTRVIADPNGWDDGAAWGSGGAAGLRGDIRICAKVLDGSGGVLAYNSFPSSGGDMVLDSGDNWGSTTNQHRFLRNTIMHEHGHGIGLMHVCSNTNVFLMEPFLSTAIDGPQHDDIRAGQRLYGDPQESDGSAALATDVGALLPNQTLTNFCNLPPPDVGSNPANTAACALSVSNDADFYRITVNQAVVVASTVTPLGFTYDSTQQAGDGSCPTGTSVNSLTAANLEVAVLGTNGTTVLGAATANVAGVAETVSGVLITTPGNYFVRVQPTGGTVGSTQFYLLSISGTPPPPPSCPGDANGDNRVDQDDVDTVLFNFGTSVPPNTNGDLDGNGVVNQDDIDLVLFNFGNVCS